MPSQAPATQERVRIPWSRGEKWLLGAIVAGLCGSIGSWAWMNSLDRTPEIKIPALTEPVPNGYTYFITASQMAVEGGNVSPLLKSSSSSKKWLTQPLSPAEIAACRQTATQNATALSIVRQGLALPCMAPQHRSLTSIPPWASLRHLARALHDTANAQATQGHANEAIDTALDGLDMSEKIANGGDDTDLAVSNICQEVERRSIWRMMSSLDSQSARRGAQRIAAIDAQAPPLREILTTAKWVAVTNLMQAFEKPNWRAALVAEPGANSGDPAKARAISFTSKKAILETYLKRADEVIATAHGPYQFSNRPSWPASSMPSTGVQDLDDSTSIMSDETWFQDCQSSADRRLLELALALRAYQLDHGSYPVSLTALAPKYVPAIPADPFSNGPFIYKITHDGYLLYSVGPDGKDDGGKPVNTSTGRGYHYIVNDSRGDIVAGLNE